MKKNRAGHIDCPDCGRPVRGEGSTLEHARLDAYMNAAGHDCAAADRRERLSRHAAAHTKQPGPYS